MTRSWLSVIVVAAFVFGADAHPVSQSPTPPAVATSAMVSSAHPLATEAGLEILRAGGNAFDAAVAIATALNVGGYNRFPEHAKAIFGRDGKPLGQGERLRQKDLAKSLQLIADGGADVFYKGSIAHAIDAAMKEAKGFLRLSDLEKDEAEWSKPISIQYRDVQVVTASPPANAFDYLARLGIMSQFDPVALKHNSVEYLHRFAEATKHGFWVRLRYAGDPDVAPPPLSLLLSQSYWIECESICRTGMSGSFACAIEWRSIHLISTPPCAISLQLILSANQSRNRASTR